MKNEIVMKKMKFILISLIAIFSILCLSACSDMDSNIYSVTYISVDNKQNTITQKDLYEAYSLDLVSLSYDTNQQVMEELEIYENYKYFLRDTRSVIGRFTQIGMDTYKKMPSYLTYKQTPDSGPQLYSTKHNCWCYLRFNVRYVKTFGISVKNSGSMSIITYYGNGLYNTSNPKSLSISIPTNNINITYK